MTTISSKDFLGGGKITVVNTSTPNVSDKSAQKPEKTGALGTIKNAFRGGVEKTKESYMKGVNAKNPADLVESGLGVGAGIADMFFSPIAPITEPTIGKATQYASDKISDIPEVQQFSQTKAGENVARGAEDIANISTIAGAVAGAKTAPKVAGVASDVVGGVTSKVKPTVAGAGRVLKNAGESAYGVTVEQSPITARAVASYKEKSPNLISRIKSELSGQTEGKPTTEANTAARFGLIGTEKEIGVQAGRYMTDTWINKVQPALKSAKGKLEMSKFWGVIEKKIRKENPELTRRNALLEGLNDLKGEYGKVSRVGLEKLQNYKEGWTKFQSENAWKGKPIASTTKEVMMMAGDIARDFIYKNTPEETRQAYIDYGNLKSIKEAGIKSGVGDPAKKSISRGAWQFVMDKAVTPIATTMGKILYRTGEGLEFIGEPGAKTVGEVVGETPK